MNASISLRRKTAMRPSIGRIHGMVARSSSHQPCLFSRLVRKSNIFVMDHSPDLPDLLVCLWSIGTIRILLTVLLQIPEHHPEGGYAQLVKECFHGSWFLLLW